MTTEPNDELGRLGDMNTRADALAMADIGGPGSTPAAGVTIHGSTDSRSESLHSVVTFDDFYRLHYTPIARALAITLGDQQLGNEAADEAMTRAYGKWQNVSSYANPAGWTYKVGLNWGRSWHRKVATRAAILRRQPPTDAAHMPPTADLALHEAMSQLDPKYRGVVVCRYLLDWSTEQTAEALDLAPGTVKSRLSVGLDRLRTTLETTPSLETGTK